MQVAREGQNPFERTTENANSEESSTETNETNATQASEGDENSVAKNSEGAPQKGERDPKSGLNVPPIERWQEREADWKNRFNDQEKRHAREMEALRQELGTRIEEATKSSKTQNVQLPEWFGGDENQWSAYSAHTQELINKAVEKALAQVSAKSQQDQELVDKANKRFESEVLEIEADKELNPQGQKVDRNKLLKFAMDEYFVTPTGEWDYKKAFKYMKPADVFQVKAALNERKKFANATTSDNRPESKPQDFATSESFVGSKRPW